MKQSRKTIEKINKLKHWLFEKVKKRDKPLARQNKKKIRFKLFKSRMKKRTLQQTLPK